MVKEALGDRSISNGLFVWHPRNQYPVGHNSPIRFQIVKGMPFFIKEGQGNSEMGGWERRPVFMPSDINAFSER